MKTKMLAALLSFLYLATAQAVEVHFVELDDFSADEKERVIVAGAVLERVLNSAELREAVVTREFVDDLGLSGREIYELLQSRPVELRLELYNPPWWRRKSVVGWTSPNDPVIHLNRWWFTRLSHADIAANLAHEWMHKLGFDHDYRRTARRSRSVPYAIGAIVGGLAEPLEFQQ